MNDRFLERAVKIATLVVLIGHLLESIARLLAGIT